MDDGSSHKLAELHTSYSDLSLFRNELFLKLLTFTGINIFLSHLPFNVHTYELDILSSHHICLMKTTLMA
jgi:hypothetical protein